MSNAILVPRKPSTATTAPELSRFGRRHGPEAFQELSSEASTSTELEEWIGSLEGVLLARRPEAAALALPFGHSSTQSWQAPPPAAAFVPFVFSTSDALTSTPAYWSYGPLVTTPSAEDPETRKQREENQRAISLLESWLQEPEPSGDLDEASLRQLIEDVEEDRPSARRRFADAGGAS